MSPGAIADRYRLEEPLGRSTMSEVWRATDLELGRTVAIKLLAPTADTERFRREARAIASLAHENVNVLYDYGQTEDGRPYMVLEYLTGGSLADLLEREGALPIEEARRIATGIAAGLAQAYANGVVHRDLKPANILFDGEGRPKLADFGIARLAAGSGTLTDEGTVLGTAATISPEQAAGEPATAASDVYSLGAILFRMLTGRLPFEADDALELLRLHRDVPAPPVEELRPDVPPALAALTAAMLAKDPAERPADGSAVLAALSGATPPQETTLVLPPPPPPRRGSPARAVGVVALLLLALAGGAVGWAVTRSDAKPAQAPATGPTLPAHTGKTKPTTTRPATAPPAAATTTAAPTTTHPATTHPATTRPAITRPATTTIVVPPTTTAPPPPTTTAPPPTTTAPPTTDTTTTAVTT